MTPRRRTSDSLKGRWREFMQFRVHAGYVLAFAMTVFGSSYFKDWVSWQFGLEGRVSAIEVDRARGIEAARVEKVATKKELEDQITVLREDVREIRRANAKPTKD